MKVRLPLQLFRQLIRILSIPCFTLGSVSLGGIMHQDASFQTYTDFGQNMGRYPQAQPTLCFSISMLTE